MGYHVFAHRGGPCIHYGRAGVRTLQCMRADESIWCGARAARTPLFCCAGTRAAFASGFGVLYICLAGRGRIPLFAGEHAAR